MALYCRVFLSVPVADDAIPVLWVAAAVPVSAPLSLFLAAAVIAGFPLLSRRQIDSPCHPHEAQPGYR
jgi:hypothetical protein